MFMWWGSTGPRRLFEYVLVRSPTTVWYFLSANLSCLLEQACVSGMLHRPGSNTSKCVNRKFRTRV